MRSPYRIGELILGAIFCIGGVNGGLVIFGLSPFFPVNSSSPLAVALTETAYVFYLQKALEFAAGGLLVLGLYRWMALLVLGPLVTGIFLFHVFEDSARVGIGLAVLFLYMLAMAGHSAEVRRLFKR